MSEKEYIRAVLHRSRLPRSVRRRLRADLESDFAARRAKGQSDAEIIAAMGPADQLAAGFAEEFAPRPRSGRETAEIPVIMLTARTAEMDRVAGLESGADDYVVKPFGLMELQARIKAVLRRTRRQENGVLRCGELEVDPAARTVRRGGEPVELTYKEFELLRLLVSRRGSVLTRDEILHAVWDYDFTGETRTVDMHIKSLRQKLGDGFISTVRGVGYKID